METRLAHTMQAFFLIDSPQIRIHMRDRTYDKKCDRPSIILDLLYPTIDKRQAELNARHSIPCPLKQ
jgi:hypothetical protein